MLGIFFSCQGVIMIDVSPEKGLLPMGVVTIRGQGALLL